MSVAVIAFFNHKSRVGRTSLIYHLAWMFADLFTTVLAVDLDPQADLTAACLDDDHIDALSNDQLPDLTLYGCIEPLMRDTEDFAIPESVSVSDGFALLPGSLRLAALEDELASQWLAASAGNERALHVISALHRIIQGVAAAYYADIVLVDLGPNLGSINRAASIVADYLVVPLLPDRFALQAIRDLGTTLARWRNEWRDRLNRNPAGAIELPGGHMTPLGYTVLRPTVRLDRPVKQYDKWIKRIPEEYRTYILSEPAAQHIPVQDDPHRLAMLKNYPSLMPMAEEARKPMFHLKPADGAMGSHLQSAHEARKEFEALARLIGAKAAVAVPSLS